MKIISQFKDYYDFVAGHDTDPRKIYVRKTKIFKSWDTDRPIINYKEIRDNTMASVKEFFTGEVYFCNNRYPYLQDLLVGKIYFHYNRIPEDIKEQYNKIRSRINARHHSYSDRVALLETIFDIKIEKKKTRWSVWSDRQEAIHAKIAEQKRLQEIPLNRKFNDPIIFSRIREGLHAEIVMSGSLEEISFNQIKTPTEAFQEIYNWIEYTEPEVPDDPTDTQRFEGKGFDAVTSFRH